MASSDEIFPRVTSHSDTVDPQCIERSPGNLTALPLDGTLQEDFPRHSLHPDVENDPKRANRRHDTSLFEDSQILGDVEPTLPAGEQLDLFAFDCSENDHLSYASDWDTCAPFTNDLDWDLLALGIHGAQQGFTGPSVQHGDCENREFHQSQDCAIESLGTESIQANEAVTASGLFANTDDDFFRSLIRDWDPNATPTGSPKPAPTSQKHLSLQQQPCLPTPESLLFDTDCSIFSEQDGRKVSIAENDVSGALLRARPKVQKTLKGIFFHCTGSKGTTLNIFFSPKSTDTKAISTAYDEPWKLHTTSSAIDTTSERSDEETSDSTSHTSLNASVASDTELHIRKRQRRMPRNEGGYLCRGVHCKKVFNTAGERRKHEASHMPESRRYPCERCGRRFRYPKDLRRHSYTHARSRSVSVSSSGSEMLAESESLS